MSLPRGALGLTPPAAARRSVFRMWIDHDPVEIFLAKMAEENRFVNLCVFSDLANSGALDAMAHEKFSRHLHNLLATVACRRTDRNGADLNH